MVAFKCFHGEKPWWLLIWNIGTSLCGYPVAGEKPWWLTKGSVHFRIFSPLLLQWSWKSQWLENPPQCLPLVVVVSSKDLDWQMKSMSLTG